MKAMVYEGVESLALRDVPDPVPGSGDHMIRVAAVGICGSDMHAYLGHDDRRPAPLILGHEAAGTIIGGLRDGDRVTINPLVTCGHCPACSAGRDNLCPTRQIISMPPREGAFAERVAMPEENLVSIPDGVPFERAALAEPMAVSWHAARLALGALDEGYDRRALVIGGGTIGLAAALCLRAMGCEDVTIVEPTAIRRAHISGYSDIATCETAGGQFPIVIDAVGYAATRTVASQSVLAGGVILHVGLGEDTGGLDIRRMTLQEITFIGTYAYAANDFRAAAAAIFDGSLGALDWFETRPLADGPAAFRDLRHGRVAAPKIILIPGSPNP